jgi:hypothetical protein
VVASLVEGKSIGATVGMAGVAKNPIVKLLADLGRSVFPLSGRDDPQRAHTPRAVR